MKTAPMTPQIAEAVIDEFLTTIAERLDRAAAVAKAAVACMEAGNREQAVTIVMGVEEIVFDVNTFLKCRHADQAQRGTLSRVSLLPSSSPASANRRRRGCGRAARFLRRNRWRIS